MSLYDEVPVNSPRSSAGGTSVGGGNRDKENGGRGGGRQNGAGGETGCAKFKKLFRCTGCTPTLRTFAVFAALGGFMFGYDLGLISGAIHYMIADLGNCTQEEWLEWNLTREPEDSDFLNTSDYDAEECNTWTSGDVAIVIGAAKIGAVVGTLLCSFLLDIGRRTTVGINCAFFMAGPLVMALSEGTAGLIAGRFIVGLGVGIGSVVSPLYMSEMSPPTVRGRVVMLYVVFLAIGVLMSVVCDYVMIDLPDNWRFMVGVPAVLAAVQVWIVCIAPRSPFFLIDNGIDDEAREVLAKLYPGGPDGVEVEFQEIKTKILKLRKIAKKRIEEHGQACCNGCACLAKYPKARHQAQLVAVNARELTKGAESKQFSVVVLFAFFSQACGSTAIINYAPTIFANVGVEIDEAIIMSAALGAIKLLGVCVSVFIVDSSGFYLMTLALCGLAAADHLLNAPLALISALMCMVAFSFMNGLGASAVMFGVGALADVLFAIMIDAIGYGTFLVFAAFAFMGALHVQLMLPETKGRKLTEIRRLFKDYTCAVGCRVYMCPCILNRQRIVVGERHYRTREEAIAAHRRGEVPGLPEGTSDSETDDSDDFADVKSDVGARRATTVAQVVLNDEHSNDDGSDSDGAGEELQSAVDVEVGGGGEGTVELEGTDSNDGSA